MVTEGSLTSSPHPSDPQRGPWAWLVEADLPPPQEAVSPPLDTGWACLSNRRRPDVTPPQHACTLAALGCVRHARTQSHSTWRVLLHPHYTERHSEAQKGSVMAQGHSA